MGIVSSPLSVGDFARAICMYCVRKTVVPNIATPTAMLASTAITIVRSEKSRSGISGSGACRITSTAAQESAAPSATRRPDCQETQSKLVPASDTQISRLETPPATSSAPGKSRCTSRRGLSGRCSVRWRTTKAATANGTPT